MPTEITVQNLKDKNLQDGVEDWADLPHLICYIYLTTGLC